MQPVVIYGAGAQLAIDVEEACLRRGMKIIAAVRNVNGPTYVSSRVPVVDAVDATDEMKEAGLALPMFTPAHRRTVLAEALHRGFKQVATIIDPTAVVASSAVVGPGVFVNAGATIGGASRLGELALINRSVNVGHHVRLDNFVSVGPGAVIAANVAIGRGAVIGAGAIVLPNVLIGANAIVGAGAVVTRQVPPNSLAIGNPARITKTGLVGYNGEGV